MTGGNRIPASYLAKFLPSSHAKDRQGDDMPYELRIFLDNFGLDRTKKRG